MLYPADVKRELETILDAFEEYIRGQDYFDVIYSEKFGYLWIAVPGPGVFDVRTLNTANEMLESLFRDVIDTVVFSPDNPTQEHMDLDLTEYEEREGRRWITAILETIETEDKAHYLDLLDVYIKGYPESMTPTWGEEE